MASATPPATPEEAWHPARLIPTGGIKGQLEQEKRATSALLAVLKAVPEFAQAILKPIGAPKGQVSSFVEIQLKDGAGKVHIPDGAIVVQRGKTRWSCLVEVKTGDGELTTEQVTRYVDMAKKHGFDAVLTISSAITSSVDDLPMVIHGTKLRMVPVKHLSWWRIITEAVVQERYRGIADPDQAWILQELIAYLDHEASGAAGFKDMAAGWVAARDAAHAGTLRTADEGAKDICQQFDRFTDYLALGLEQDLGVDVAVVRAKKSTTDERLTAALGHLVDQGCLSASIRIEDTAGALDLRADLRTRRVSTSCVVRAPDESKPLTRIRWLLRQLDEAPVDTRVEVIFKGSSETTSVLLGEAREAPEKLLSPTDAKREPRGFVVELTRPMGAKRGKVKGSFVGDTKAQVGEFYRVVLQHLSPWRPKPAKLRETEGEATPKTPSAKGAAFIDGDRETGEAVAVDEVPVVIEPRAAEQAPGVDEVSAEEEETEGGDDEATSSDDGATQESDGQSAAGSVPSPSQAGAAEPTGIAAGAAMGESAADSDAGLSSLELYNRKVKALEEAEAVEEAAKQAAAAARL